MSQSNHDQRVKEGIKTGKTGLMINIILVAIKAAAALMSNSISILADAMNSLGDCASSILTIVGFHLSSKPADRHHPYGHQRAEYVAGLIIDIIILSVGLEFLISSIEKIFNPTSIVSSPLIFILLVLSITIKIGLAFFYYQKNKKLKEQTNANSNTILSLMKDSLNDSIMSSVIIVSYIVETQFGWQIDGYIGVLAAALILYSGITSIIDSTNILLGIRPDPEIIDEMQQILDSYDTLIGYHDLNLHEYGPNKAFATVDIEVDSRWDSMKTHNTINEIEKQFDAQMDIKLVTHVDPIDIGNKELNRLHASIKKILKAHGHDFHFHDFRLESDNGLTAIHFDVVVPDSIKASDEELYTEITTEIYEEIGDYPLHITFDRDYILKE